MVLGIGFYFPTFFVLALLVGGCFVAYYFYRKHQREQEGGVIAANGQPTAVNADGHNNDPSNHGHAQSHPQGGGQSHPDGGIYGIPQHQEQPYYPPPPAHHQGHPPAGYHPQGGGDIYTSQGYQQPSADNDNKAV